MKITCDAEADAWYIEIADVEFGENREPMPGVILDIGKRGELLGTEILDASHRCPPGELAHVEITMPLQGAASPNSPNGGEKIDKGMGTRE